MKKEKKRKIIDLPIDDIAALQILATENSYRKLYICSIITIILTGFIGLWLISKNKKENNNYGSNRNV